MGVNLDKPHLWKNDIAASVDMYNDWFMNFAPKAFRETRVRVTKDVEETLQTTKNLTDVSPSVLRSHPETLPSLRMSACPPLAVDRLIGLSGCTPSVVKRMEKEKKLPSRMGRTELDKELRKIGYIIEKMADPDIFVWIETGKVPTTGEKQRAATIVADRLCGTVANPIIRNAQEKRQLASIKKWLEGRGYRLLLKGDPTKFDQMQPGTFSFRMNVPVTSEGGRQINMPIDAVVMPRRAEEGDFPLLFEAKSAGDFANVNKRRKEEATKMAQLKHTFGSNVEFVLFLCGYFDGGYLGYEAAEGIDWVWEHRIDDLEGFGL